MRNRPPAILWITFAYMLAGVNLINPLLPLIRSRLGVSMGGVATLYSLYLIALVPLLLLLPSGRWGVTARTRLLLALGLTAVADVLHALGPAAALGAGRLLLAGSVALGTASVAELGVLTAGEEGRTVTATANTAGALVGTLIGGAGLVLARSPVPVVFLAHGLAASILPAFILGGVPDLGPQGVVPDPTRGLRHAGGRLDGMVLGGFAFAAAATVIVLGTTLFEQDHSPLGDRALLVPVAMFLAAAVAQSRVSTSRRSIYAAGLITLAGLGLVFSSVVAGSFPLLVLSAALTGVGFGAVFMLGLAWTTHNVAESAQAPLASAYACIAYAAAATVTMGSGYLADAAGGPTALLVILLADSAAFLVWAGQARSYLDPFGPPGGDASP